MIQTSEQVAADIEAAADVIRINGLNKGDFWPGAGDDDDPWLPGYPVCAFGALAVARKVSWSEATACLAGAVLDAQLDGNLVEWNDAPSTTAEMVVEKLLHVAKDLRNGEIVSPTISAA